MNRVENYIGCQYKNMDAHEKIEYRFLCSVLSLENLLINKPTLSEVKIHCYELFKNDNLTSVSNFLKEQAESYENDRNKEMYNSILYCSCLSIFGYE